jgi:flagellar protein FliO/FliZ
MRFGNVLASAESKLAAPRWKLTAVAIGAAAILAAAFAGGEEASLALRCGAVLGALAVAGAWARRKSKGRGAPILVLAVVSKQSLGKDCGVAVIEADGRRLLVGFGSGGATLVADLDLPAAARTPVREATPEPEN